MRIPNTERFQYYTPQFDHFELAPHRDLVRRSNWSPGYYGMYVPLLSPTLEPDRVQHPDGTETNAQQPPMSGKEPDAGEADS
jgi:hypothetical protein